MPGPLIAIAGSAEPERDYDPPVDCDAARAAAEQLGAELAKAGCRIIVYSSKNFIERDVVRGFVAEAKEPKAIQVRCPAGSKADKFPECQDHRDLFDFHADPHREWEISYYRSLREADGVLLIGGGQATLITGHLALAERKPLVALGTFGGAASRVWGAITPGEDLVTKDERNLFGRPQWADDSAAACVRALLDQHERRAKDRAAAQRAKRELDLQVQKRSVSVILLVLVTLVVLAVGLGWSAVGAVSFQALLMSAGAFAGAAGATVRTLWAGETDQSTVRGVALGVAAGFISSLLYIVSQVAANPAMLGTGATPASDPPRLLLLFAVLIGFIADFTFDAVYRKLARTDVVHTGAVQVKES
ncbi:hypothetical protein [Azospirillum rugosum]|uniref:Uncharacterized protein n=1 Tax=Azospirillum rugosum TaxID=416170 RepID=A0ABS4SH17_9PROT|nr:hypothetical protein [Azospirillum rugosum]MBP2291873.1 hypothetical protein [Azospirillum rugosum]MDQ0524315.1 hypothetical protein [Azospirillum rugosum]